jgi:hypothetical protein
MIKQVLIRDSSIKKCVFFHAPDRLSKQMWKVGVVHTSCSATAYRMGRMEGCEELTAESRQIGVQWHRDIPELKVLHSLDLLKSHVTMNFFKVHVLFQVP